jgi:protein-S-isoprenylcysteine O-methyltransferase Ste14
VTKHKQLANVTLRELAWLGAFVFWAYYKKPDGVRFLDIRLDPLGVIGVGLIVAGVVAHLWSAIVLAVAICDPTDVGGGLAKDGPYLYVRNPLYIAGAMIFLGVYLIYAEFRIVDLVAAVVVGLLLHFYVVCVEEPATMKRLGATYAEYWRRVPRWAPRFPFTLSDARRSR